MRHDRMMIACCNDGTRPVIFKIERIDIPENDEERAWLSKQDYRNNRSCKIISNHFIKSVTYSTNQKNLPIVSWAGFILCSVCK